jgi:hypothetical protein
MRALIRAPRRLGAAAFVRWLVASPSLMPAALLLLATCCFLFNPIVFMGGGSDDARYLAAAREWIAHGPVVGMLHWDLRHPLVLPVAAATRLLGESAGGLLLVPLGYALALMLLGLLWLRARFGAGVAALWGVFFATSPLVHELATRIYPDVAEAFFVLASLAACDAARRRAPAHRAGLLVLAGVTAALALLTRETSAWLALLYAGGFVLGRPFTRRAWLWVAAGAVPLLALETAWLWQATGDPLHRLHVALNHVEVPSNHMRGRVFKGAVFFNADLASRWLVRGPVDVNWTVNPLLYFFIDSFYGGAAILLAALGFVSAGCGRGCPVQRACLRRMVALAIVSFAFVTYVLMVSQRPRYYLLPLLVVMVVNAVLATRLWRRRRAAVAALVGLHLVASGVIVALRDPPRHGLPAHDPAARVSAA